MGLELTTFFELTKTRFAEYRLNKPGAHYSKELKEAALKLLCHYPAKNLEQGLGVLGATLRNWQKSKAGENAISCVEFVPLTLTEPLEAIEQAVPNGTAATLTLHLPKGLSLSLPKQSVSQTVAFITALVKGF